MGRPCRIAVLWLVMSVGCSSLGGDSDLIPDGTQPELQSELAWDDYR